MKTYFYRPVGMKYDPKLSRKNPITLCELCAWHERGNAILTTKHELKSHCDKCGKGNES